MPAIAIAIYLDLENLPKGVNFDSLLKHLKSDETRCVYAVKSAYGTAASISNGYRQQLADHNFLIVDTPHVVKKKNRADLLISIDAFERLLVARPAVDRFVFVSSDSDFSVIMDKLRAYGKQVWLVCRKADHATKVLVRSCDRMLFVEDFIPLPPPAPPPASPPPVSKRAPASKPAPAPKTAPARKTEAAPKPAPVSKTAPPPKPAPAKSVAPKKTPEKDQLAQRLFKQVLRDIGPSGLPVGLGVVGSRMRKIDKEFDFKGTSFKRLSGLATHFEKAGTVRLGHDAKRGSQIEDMDDSQLDVERTVRTTLDEPAAAIRVEEEFADRVVHLEIATAAE